MTKQIEIVAEGLAFPEGPVAMTDGSVLVVEMVAGNVTRCWNGKSEVIAQVGGGPNGAAVGPDGALYLCNNGGLDFATASSATGPGTEGRIERLDLSTGKLERVFEIGGEIRLSGPNDLMFASDGSMWFTDFGKLHDRLHHYSALFHCDPAAGWIECVDDFAVSYNGVGVSPDGSTVYVADTFRARIYAFDARLRGAQKPRLVATVPGQVDLDSLAMTASGAVCVGTLLEGGISSVAPDGTVSKPFSSAEPYVTNICFGGADMRDAFITLSTTGKLVKTRWDEPGMTLHFNA